MSEVFGKRRKKNIYLVFPLPGCEGDEKSEVLKKKKEKRTFTQICRYLVARAMRCQKFLKK